MAEAHTPPAEGWLDLEWAMKFGKARLPLMPLVPKEENDGRMYHLLCESHCPKFQAFSLVDLPTQGCSH